MHSPSYRHAQPLRALWTLWWRVPCTVVAGLTLLGLAGPGLRPAVALLVACQAGGLLLGRLRIELDEHQLSARLGAIRTRWPKR